MGSVLVLVRRRDGTPVAGASVVLGGAAVADDRGRASFEGVGVGRHLVHLREPGLVPTSIPVDVVEGRTTEVVLREPQGSTLDVVVVDESDRPASFARIEVVQPSETPWLDVDEQGVQRVDDFVDERGRRALARVEAGPVEVRARWGRRTGRAEVAADDGGFHRVVIRVAPPEPVLADVGFTEPEFEPETQPESEPK